jgi:hypothetical protein
MGDDSDSDSGFDSDSDKDADEEEEEEWAGEEYLRQGNSCLPFHTLITIPSSASCCAVVAQRAAGITILSSVDILSFSTFLRDLFMCHRTARTLSGLTRVRRVVLSRRCLSTVAPTLELVLCAKMWLLL